MKNKNNMNKKGASITLFIIIGIIIVISVLIIASLRKTDASKSIKSQGRQAINLASIRGSLQYFITDCLKKVSLDGRNNCGINNCIHYIEKYVDKNIKECASELVPFYADSFEVIEPDDGEIKTSVEISDDAYIINLFYPFELIKEDQSIKISHFKFLIKREIEIQSPGGIVPKDTVLMSSDGRARLYFNPDVDTYVTDNKGNPVNENVSLSFIDTNFEDLQNRVVIGTVVFNGQPDGIQFDPCVRMEIDINENKIPAGFPPEDIKIGWYDQPADIWRTYVKQFGTKKKSGEPDIWTASACVDHFSYIGTVDCSTETYTYLIPDSREGESDYFFQEKILPADSWYWTCNGEEPTDVCPGEGIHLIPEAMYGEYETGECQGLSITEYNSPDCDSMIKDWNEDDQEPQLLVDKIKTVYVDVDIGRKSESVISSAKEHREGCISKCKAAIDKKMKEKFGADVRISNDAVNDAATPSALYCIGKGEYVDCDDLGPGHPQNECGDVIISSITECNLADSITNNGYSDNIDEKGSRSANDKDTMEFVDNGFFASPETYGYATVKSVGGTTNVHIEFRKEGNSCSDDNAFSDEAFEEKVEDFSAMLLYEEPSSEKKNLGGGSVTVRHRIPIDDFTYSVDDAIQQNQYTYTCTDECIYIINGNTDFEGHFKGGSNTFEIKFNNLQGPEGRAKGKLQFSGKGIIDVEFIPAVSDTCGEVNNPDGVSLGYIERSIQSRVNYYHDCKGVAPPQTWSDIDPTKEPPNDNIYETELNCILDYRQWQRSLLGANAVMADDLAIRNLDMCGLDWGAAAASGFGRLAACKERIDRGEIMKPESMGGGYCLEGVKICREGILTDDDLGCKCGPNEPGVYTKENFESGEQPFSCCGEKQNPAGTTCRQTTNDVPCADPDLNTFSRALVAGGRCSYCENGGWNEAPNQEECTSEIDVPIPDCKDRRQSSTSTCSGLGSGWTTSNDCNNCAGMDQMCCVKEIVSETNVGDCFPTNYCPDGYKSATCNENCHGFACCVAENQEPTPECKYGHYTCPTDMVSSDNCGSNCGGYACCVLKVGESAEPPFNFIDDFDQLGYTQAPGASTICEGRDKNDFWCGMGKTSQFCDSNGKYHHKDCGWFQCSNGLCKSDIEDKGNPPTDHHQVEGKCPSGKTEGNTWTEGNDECTCTGGLQYCANKDDLEEPTEPSEPVELPDEVQDLVDENSNIVSVKTYNEGGLCRAEITYSGSSIPIDRTLHEGVCSEEGTFIPPPEEDPEELAESDTLQQIEENTEMSNHDKEIEYKNLIDYDDRIKRLQLKNDNGNCRLTIQYKDNYVDPDWPENYNQIIHSGECESGEMDEYNI